LPLDAGGLEELKAFKKALIFSFNLASSKERLPKEK
jgi:hypothetical protein